MNPKTTLINIKLLNVPKRQKKLLEIIKDEAKKFCFSTALHGYRFIVLSKRILLERVIWLIVCLASLAIALTLLCIAWFNFQEVPTDVVTDSTYYPIANYLFPAVTICSFNLVSKSEAFRLAKKLNRTELAWDFRLLAQLIHSTDPNIPKENYTRLNNLLTSNKLSIVAALEYVMPACDTILKRCKWKGEEKMCESIFERVRTSEGVCCAFNYFALKKHTFSAYSTNTKGAATEPRKVSACGSETGLEILVDNNPDDYFASYIPSIGHKVILHNPYYFPDWTQQIILNKMKTSNFINIYPTVTYSTDGIRRMAISKRKCLFSDERSLLNFKQYNFHNCMVECRMNLTVKFCGCKPFYYITEDDDHGGNICKLQDIRCLEENRHLIDSSVPGFDFSSVGPSHVYGSEEGECDCLPDCENTEYLADYAIVALNRTYCHNQVDFFGGITISNHSVIRVFFKDLVAKKNRRDVIFNWDSLLAYYGGILGLFTGLSFISGIEIIYFFTIRLVHDILKRKNTSMASKGLQKHHKNTNTTIRVWPNENLEPRRSPLPMQIDERKRNCSFYHMYLD